MKDNYIGTLALISAVLFLGIAIRNLQFGDYPVSIINFTTAIIWTVVAYRWRKPKHYHFPRRGMVYKKIKTIESLFQSSNTY